LEVEQAGTDPEQIPDVVQQLQIVVDARHVLNEILQQLELARLQKKALKDKANIEREAELKQVI
jgi:thiamine pyrophosphate-dependent acetolactate synthase large subunit-like protein